MPENEKTKWASRISHADKYYESWATRFRCARLEEYWRGFQFNFKALDPEGQLPYTLNMFFSTLEIKLASYSFSDIRFVVQPKPQKMDYNIELAIASAEAKSDALNTIISNPRANFQDEIEAALKDSFFRFGVIEVGYGADWVTNPNAGRPLFESDVDPDADPEKAKILVQPERVPENELVYAKRIDASRFRIGGVEGRYLHQCNWYGYYDFYYTDDLKASKALRNTEKLEVGSHRTTEFDEEITKLTASDEEKDLLKSGNLIKVWKLYDNRSKTCILYEPLNDVILYESPFTRDRILDLRWTPDLKGWYPVPPAFQWFSPQDEINEARNMMRSFRRRFVDQYQAQEGMVEEEELDKFELARDGAIIKTKKGDAIQPIQKPTQGSVVPETMIVGKDDFVLMSGSSADAFGVGDRVTATQTMEVSRRTQVRENREQIKVSRWISKIGATLLATAQEKFISGLWVKSSIDGGETFGMEVQEKSVIWQYIASQQLQDGVDYDVDVLITSMSPVANEDEKRKFMEFQAVLAQYPQISFSPTLVREAAYRIGYRNERVIKEAQTMALIMMTGMMAQAGAAQNGGTEGTGNRAAQMKTAQMTPNTGEQITNQIAGQLN
jgi:hypothetical protein